MLVVTIHLARGLGKISNTLSPSYSFQTAEDQRTGEASRLTGSFETRDFVYVTGTICEACDRSHPGRTNYHCIKKSIRLQCCKGVFPLHSSQSREDSTQSDFWQGGTRAIIFIPNGKFRRAFSAVLLPFFSRPEAERGGREDPTDRLHSVRRAHTTPIISRNPDSL